VLDRVRHVGGRPVDARLPGAILLVARLLADEDDRRAGRPLAEDGLRPGLPERAEAAAGGLRAELVERRHHR
jgi:hypothetical protein